LVGDERLPIALDPNGKLSMSDSAGRACFSAVASTGD
jgi:hypothetical protein